MAGSPMPVATSSTRWPGATCASSISRSLSDCAPCSKTAHRLRQPCAAALHCARCSALNAEGSSCASPMVLSLLPFEQQKGPIPIGIEPAFVRLHPDESHRMSRLCQEAVPPSRNRAHPLCGPIGVEHGDRRGECPTPATTSYCFNWLTFDPHNRQFSRGRSVCFAYLSYRNPLAARRQSIYL